MARGFVFKAWVAVAAALAVGASPVAAASGFQAVPSPNVAGSNYNELDAVAANGAGQAWSVGFARVGSGPFRALIERGSGTTWSIVPPAALPATDDTRLHGLAVASPTDIWAVGSDLPSSGTGHSLIEHWNGTAWATVAAPAADPAGSELLAATAIASDNVWAVGNSRSPSTLGFSTLVEHWDGSAWHVVPGAPITATGHDFLMGVAGSGSNDVWAVGRSFRHPVPIVEHWNGAAWTQVAQPVSGYDSDLASVTVLSSTDAWAVGSQNLSQTVTEHWDGTGWTLVPSPFPTAGNAQNFLTGVAALGHGDVWAVGFTFATTTFQNQTLAEHWDGTAWSLVSSPDPSPGDSLAGVAGSAAGQPLWAAGNQVITGGNYHTLVLQTTG